MSDILLHGGAHTFPNAERSPWAVLGIPAEADAAERRRLLLQHVERADHLPPPVWRDAIEVLAGELIEGEEPVWLLQPALRLEIEDGLRNEIDQLAKCFFTIQRSDRQDRWNGLYSICDNWPPLRARLGLLEPGISIEPGELETHGDASIACLVDWIVRLFPLDAASRRRLTGEALGTMSESSDRWEEAGASLERHNPRIAALVPEFLSAVASLGDRRREEVTRSAACARNAAEEAEWESHNPWYYFDSWRWNVVLYCVFGGVPLLLVLIDILYGYMHSPAPPAQPDSNGSAPAAGPNDFSRGPDSWRRRRSPPPAGRGENSR